MTISNYINPQTVTGNQKLAEWEPKVG